MDLCFCLFIRAENKLTQIHVSIAIEWKSNMENMHGQKERMLFRWDERIYWFSWISDGRFYCIEWEELFGAGEKSLNSPLFSKETLYNEKEYDF